MIKKFILFTFILIASFQITFSQPVSEIQETARGYMRQSDYKNAIIVLSRLFAREPNNTSVSKDLALSYFYMQDNEKALEFIKPVLGSKDADDQCFLIAGNIYKQLGRIKDCEKIYKKGVKVIPESGPLQNELGEVQLALKNRNAIKSWENGIKYDPSYSKNYYNAAKFYLYNKNAIWSILYGEIFLNMEPNNPNSVEMKVLLLDSYKTLFLDLLDTKAKKEKNEFANKYMNTMNLQVGQTAFGISVESLSMIRARFIIDWFVDTKNPAYKLFDMQKQLLKEGLFESYNQWLFGPAENLGNYQNWVKTNATEYNAFLKFQSSTIFKMPKGQYYH
jgi:tetratricopeptide (TPR) repeat protein